jgi:hypothetical protein
MTTLTNTHNDQQSEPLPHARLHDLRHVHATTLQVSGVATAASFDGSGERALTAMQRAALSKLGATGALAPCVTWDAIIRLHQAGR